MIYFFIIQFIVIQFSVACAIHDSVAVNHFEGYGFRTDNQLRHELSKFHSSNSWLKFFFCCAASLYALPDWITAIAVGLVCAFWIWFAFDISLNCLRKLKWYYLGEDQDGSRWKKVFGSKAGIYKAVILFLIILIINIIWVKSK